MDNQILEYHPFFVDRIALIVPAGHPWSPGGVVSPLNLLEEDFLMREESSGTRKAIVEGLARHHIKLEDLNVSLELGNAEAIEMSVEAGLGISFVSVLAAAKGIELGRVCVVKVEGMELVRPVLLARTLQHAPTRAQTAFCEFVSLPENQEHLRTLLEPRALVERSSP